MTLREHRNDLETKPNPDHQDVDSGDRRTKEVLPNDRGAARCVSKVMGAEERSMERHDLRGGLRRRMRSVNGGDVSMSHVDRHRRAVIGARTWMVRDLG